MNKWNEIEIQTAENLLKNGYKWITREKNGKIWAYKNKPHRDKDQLYCAWNYNGDYFQICTRHVPIFLNVTCADKEPVSLESIVHPQILDDAERRYLKGVIRPFRKSVRYIEKKFVDDGCEYACCYLLIQFADARERMEFPTFFEKDMYKGMETYKKYTLEELGL